MDIKSLIGALLFVVVGLALTPVVADSTAGAVANGNLSSATKAILNLIPLIYVILILGGVVAYIYFTSRK